MFVKMALATNRRSSSCCKKSQERSFGSCQFEVERLTRSFDLDFHLIIFLFFRLSAPALLPSSIHIHNASTSSLWRSPSSTNQTMRLASSSLGSLSLLRPIPLDRPSSLKQILSSTQPMSSSQIQTHLTSSQLTVQLDLWPTTSHHKPTPSIPRSLARKSHHTNSPRWKSTKESYSV